MSQNRQRGKTYKYKEGPDANSDIIGTNRYISRPPLSGQFPKNEKRNNKQLYEKQEDSITSDLHDKMNLLKNFKDVWQQGPGQDANIAYDQMFKRIPLTDELLKIPDDKRLADIYNDFLKWLFSNYATMDTAEREKFLNNFPEIREHLMSRTRDCIDSNRRFAKKGLKGFFNSPEDMREFYQIMHEQNNKPDNGGFFSDYDKNLNLDITNAFMSLNKPDIGPSENYATGRGDISIDDNEDDVNRNTYYSGLITRTWRNLNRGRDINRENIYSNSNAGPNIGPEPFQHFLFTDKDMRRNVNENLNNTNHVLRDLINYQ